MGKSDLWRTDEERRFRVDQQQIARFFDRTQADYYDEEAARREEQTLLPFLEVNETTRVLDLGCGKGRWARFVLDRCREYVGVDISKNFVANARRNVSNAKARFVCMPAADYCVDDQYGLILVIGLMTYLNDEQAMRLSANCRKMLADGGRLIVRNVSLRDDPHRRMVYDRRPGLLQRLRGGTRYQLIRRNREEELSFFESFRLVHDEDIEGTGLTFYVFE